MINLEWVKDYIDISDQDLQELAIKITQAGINIEKVISNHIDHLKVGQVLDCKMHPDSDHLHVTLVDVGEEKPRQIVCGAPNVRTGLKVITALPGAILPKDFVIKPSKIRGVESDGMLCALYELGLEEKTEETYAKGITELDPNSLIGSDPLACLGLDDTLYELDIHKHRNNDCYYHIGFAYEIAAILNRKVTLPDDSFQSTLDNINNYITLKVETPKCSYYSAKMVTDVEIKESPTFIKKRLLSAGMRPINNVVDISNYVMLEYGQPLHFFDKDKLGNNILVRNATETEEITTLDGKERVLTSDDIVITNGEKPVCIAGVMGGLNTEVDENTQTIIIESAIFDPVSIRYTAQRLNLKSEASIRYGKGLNYEYTELALKRACHLLEKYANAKILDGTVLYDKTNKELKTVNFKAEDINKILGITIKEEDIKYELERLGFEYSMSNHEFIVTIPKRRLDIDPNVNDIAEEIGRLYGYNNLVSTLPKTSIRKGGYVGDVKYRKIISRRLRSLGLNEAKTYTLTSPQMASMFKYDHKENKVLPNPMSIDKSVLRTSLIPSLLNVYDYNKARKVENIFLYEISKTYDINYNEESKIAILMKGNYISSPWQNNALKTDFYLIKGVLENLLNYLGFKNRYHLEVAELTDMHPGISAKVFLDNDEIGIIGRIHPSIKKDDIYILELSMTKLMRNVKPLKYKAASKYPEIEKDFAFILDKNINSGDIIQTIKKASGRILKEVEVFDIYTSDNLSPNKKSIAYHLTYQDNNRTLTEEEVMQSFNKAIEAVTKEFDAVLRDK